MFKTLFNARFFVLPICLAAAAFAPLHAAQSFVAATRWHPQAQFAGLYVAEAKGFYRDEGLTVNIISPDIDTGEGALLINKTADAAVLWLLDALKLHEKGYALVNLAQFNQKPTLYFTARVSSGIEKFEDFNNKKISLWQEITPLLTEFFKQKNINATILQKAHRPNFILKSIADIAIVTYYNEYHYLLNTGLDPEDLKLFYLPDHGLSVIEDGLYMEKDVFNKNPEQACRFARATMKGWQYALENPDEAVDIVLNIMKLNFIPANRAHQSWMLKAFMDNMGYDTKTTINGTLHKNLFEESVANIKQYAPLSKAPSFNQIKADCTKYVKE